MQGFSAATMMDVDALPLEIRNQAMQLGIDPMHLAQVIGYETANTFKKNQPGPKTKWGQHEGLIQWGQPQQKEYGVDINGPSDEQMMRVGDYLKHDRPGKGGRPVEPGMGLKDIYSKVLTGGVGNYNRKDSGGSVNQHVAEMGHPNYKNKAEALMAQEPRPPIGDLAMPNRPEDMMAPPGMPPAPVMASAPPPPGPPPVQANMGGGIGGMADQMAGMPPAQPPGGFGGMAEGLQSSAGFGMANALGTEVTPGAPPPTPPMANNQPLGEAPPMGVSASAGVPNGGLPAAPQYGKAQINPAEAMSNRGMSSAGQAASEMQPMGDPVSAPDRKPQMQPAGPTIGAKSPTPKAPIDSQPLSPGSKQLGGLRAPAPKKMFKPPVKPFAFKPPSIGMGMSGGMGIQGLFGGML